MCRNFLLLSFQLMGAYLDYLCDQFSSRAMIVRQIPMFELKSIMSYSLRKDMSKISSDLHLSDVSTIPSSVVHFHLITSMK